MIYLAWNCRGIGQDSTVAALRELILLNKPYMIFLSETKARGNGIENIRRNLGYQHGFFVGARGQSGGLCLWWKDTLEVHILSSSINAIDTCVQEFASGSVVRITWMYGPPRAENKAKFWESQSRSFAADDLHWMCVGDFNELVWPHEKRGGRAWEVGRMRFLKEFMQSKELVDLGFSGPPFTWERDWENWGLIEERLDRALVNNLWTELWPNTCVSHGPLLGSDHRPLILNSCPQFVFSPKPFKFEAY
ncbi:hypothetical protein TB2_002354 [Malus domestica]